MVDQGILDELDEIMNNIDVDRLFRRMDKLLRASAELDSGLMDLNPASEKILEQYMQLAELVEKEITSILSKSALSFSYISRFHSALSPEGKMERKLLFDNKTLFYFKLVRMQQMGLLFNLTDELEIMAAMIRQAMKMRNLIEGYTSTLMKATRMIGIIGERLKKRPTTYMRMAGSDEKIEELNGIFDDIHSSESRWESRLKNDDGRESVYSPIRILFEGSKIEFDRKKQKIRNWIRELQQGWKILQKLATVGYTGRMQNPIDRLVERHNRRMDDFQRLIVENRRCLQ